MNVRSLTLVAALAGLFGCGPEEDVSVLPLPPLDAPSPEARLGLPEVAGVWRFAGWEIVRGDSTSLERTFPSFGELVLETQRLDSIAGTFQLAGGPTPVVGEVRKSGELALVTFVGTAPDRFIAGRLQRDTLWLELTSVLPPDEWPRDARAAFVREPIEAPIAWLRGARPQDLPPPLPADSLAPAADSLSGTTPGGAVITPGAPVTPPAGAAPQPQPRPAPPPPPPPPPAPRPAVPQPSPRPAPPPPPPPAPAQPDPRPSPQPQAPPPEPQPPEPEPEPEEPRLPPLLGDPIDPQ